MKKKTTEQFIFEANLVHNSIYSYEKTIYTGAHVEVVITCSIHGDFKQRPRHHLDGKKCPSCMGNKKSSLIEFVAKANKIHGNKYDYTKSTYINSSTPLIITCSIHGEFKQQPHRHLGGSGCPKCHHDKMKKFHTYSHDDFVTKAQIVHGSRYEYQPTDNYNGSSKTLIKCTKHGEFYQLSTNHLRGSGCPSCANSTSQPQKDIANIIRSLSVDCEENIRNIISPYEIDIHIPDFNLGIEYCGLRWHSENVGKKSPSYHIDKFDRCEKSGVRLITLFEDEWKSNPTLVESVIKNILGKSELGAYARNTTIRPINWKDCKEFLSNYHLQGSGQPTKVRLGAFFKNELVAVMTFSTGRAALNSTSHKTHELVRFATNGKVYPGLQSKMFSYFVNNHYPNKIVSYADKRWFTGKSYLSMGFKLDGESKPSYWYFKPNEYKRYHRYTLRKHKLIELGGDPKLTEWQNAREMGYDRIWDCGTYRFIWIKD